MRLTLGVEKFDDEAKNERLKQILAQYPFKYNLIDYTTDENAYRQGYEFVLLNISTSGQSIKKLLNYESGIKETHYISTVARDSADTEIKTIPVDALVHKYYFRRTVNHQVYVGEKWDADTSWHSALRNFIRNIRIAFKKN